MNRGAEILARRIEQGAEELAAYVAGLTEEEWRKPVRDGRSLGVVVHHVASVYPVEMRLAKAIATGKSVADIAWDAVHTVSAFANVSRVETLQLLKQNTTSAAAAVREFGDDYREGILVSQPFGRMNALNRG